LSADETPRNVRIKLRNEIAPEPGQYIEVLAGLNPPSTPALPGGFDFRKYMYFQGIGAVGFSYGAPKVLSGGNGALATRTIEQVRGRIAERVIAADDRYGAVVAALLVGQRMAIHKEDNEALRNAGLAHMLAISGLHIGLFFGVVFFCVRLLLAGFPRLALSMPIKNYAAVAAVTAAGFYMMVAGATIPTQRAMMMMALVFVAILLNRTPLSMRLVAFAACVVLLIAPESLLYPSFQMSFSAVAGLVAFFQAIKPYWSGWYSGAGMLRRVGLYVLGVMMTTLVASLSTAPFALYHFHQFAVLGIVANLLAMPVLAFLVMPFAVLFFVLMPFGLDGLVLPIMMSGVGFILDAAHFVSSSELATMHFKAWSGGYLAVFSLGFVVTLLAVGKLRYAGVLVMVCCGILASGLKRPDLLVSDDASLIAIGSDDGSYVFSSMRKNKFVREQWSEALALRPLQVVSWKDGQKNGVLQCDEYACRAEVKGQKVSVVYTPEIAAQECAWAYVLISDRPLPFCKGAQVIDRFDVYRKGAAAVFISGGNAELQHVVNPKIQRPWLPQN
jgi:competence protein ComEC